MGGSGLQIVHRAVVGSPQDERQAAHLSAGHADNRRDQAEAERVLNHDGSDEEPRRRGDLADELFREIKRRAGNNG